jgi:hypothetical protein
MIFGLKKLTCRRKRFFFEKKKQKTFANCGMRRACANARRSGSFLLLFFQKKQRLSYLNALPKRHAPFDFRRGGGGFGVVPGGVFVGLAVNFDRVVVCRAFPRAAAGCFAGPQDVGVYRV